jgi:putative sterol carrier protein
MAINNDDLNKLAGKNNFPKQVVSSVSEGEQTIDKIKSIVEGVAQIFNKVEQFKGSVKPKNQEPQQTFNGNVPQSAPVDMQQSKRATIKIDEDKLMSFIKEFSKQIPEPFLEMSLGDLLKQGEGNEQTIKAYLTRTIKEVVSVEYL